MTSHANRGFTSGSLLKELPKQLPEERFDTLLQHSCFRLEKILSLGHTTPAGEWCDQENDEWVLLLQGAAQLNIEGSGLLNLKAGDTVLLPAHCRHRVEWTDKSIVTVWLALHFEGHAATAQED